MEEEHDIMNRRSKGSYKNGRMKIRSSRLRQL
jgi:hypothetical protein